jgi:hypothetical protein
LLLLFRPNVSVERNKSVAGTIKVDIGALQALIVQLKLFRDALDAEKLVATSLNRQLDAAITGTAPNIGTFESAFSSWISQLGTLATDIDGAYIALNQVLTDAQNAVHAL